MSTYALSPGQVPEFPTSRQWFDELRWCVAVMDPDDDDVGFAASLLSYVCANGNLTDKQIKYAKRTVSMVQALWASHQLACQAPPALHDASSLADIASEGNA